MKRKSAAATSCELNQWRFSAKREGIDITHLCWLPEPGCRADGNCRACMVEIEGERVLMA
jgi:predicted molibdopterin-dependent oxidoreductase YjgC